MTINYISGGEAQKSEGAYYTPSDVIRRITRQSVDPKVYEILVDVYSSRVSEGSNLSGEDARSLVIEYDLDEMLRKIEQREGYFSDPEAIQDAYDRLGSLKVVDPACGSGHFLTSVLDEIHRVRMSLLRGLKGDDLEHRDIYKAKKELLLDSIYGVDINPIAVEIAKLRAWLKMVEEGWERDYGELPNIDVNIVDGNSLVGLPAISEGQSLLGGFDIDLDQIERVRERYKQGKIDRGELSDRIEALRPELRNLYADDLNHYFEGRIESVDQFEKLVQPLNNIYPMIRTVRVRMADDSKFSEDDKDMLEEIGFRTYTYSARLEGEELDEEEDEFRSLLEQGFALELERRPAAADVEDLEHHENLSYEPFHWAVEFPEAAAGDSNGYEVGFDIVVGNPPYGSNVLTDLEKRFTAGYKTGNMNEIASQFLERQLQLLGEDGYFGNVITLRLIYDQKTYRSREILKRKLEDNRIACFGWRPSHIFAGSEALAAIITGRKATEEVNDIQTSRFILFSEEDRKRRLEQIEYHECEDLSLGEKIGGASVGESDEKSMAKVGTEIAKRIIEKLRDASDDVIRDRLVDEETDYAVWRKEGARYWINPLIEPNWPPDERSRETKPMHFSSEVERDAAFLLLQSSAFYHHWMVYGDQQHVSWKLVRSFPFPAVEDLEEHSEEIERLKDELWEGMCARFNPDAGRNGQYEAVAELKPVVDEVDELFGPILDLSNEEIEFLKQYDAEYGRSAMDPDQDMLSNIESEAEAD